MRFRAAIPIDQSLAVEGESIYAGLGLTRRVPCIAWKKKLQQE